MTLGRLDYLYSQSDDVAADLRYLVDVLGGEQVFAIEDGGAQVAMVSFGAAPAILLTDHLDGDRPVHVYAVDDLEATAGWPRRTRMAARARARAAVGPAVTFRTPAGCASPCTSRRGRSSSTPSGAGATSADARADLPERAGMIDRIDAAGTPRDAALVQSMNRR